jgi:hypothetical protein
MIDPNKTYDIEIEGIMFCFPPQGTFDGSKWHINFSADVIENKQVWYFDGSQRYLIPHELIAKREMPQTRFDITITQLTQFAIKKFTAPKYELRIIEEKENELDIIVTTEKHTYNI